MNEIILCPTCGHDVEVHKKIGCCFIDGKAGTQACECPENLWSASDLAFAACRRALATAQAENDTLKRLTILAADCERVLTLLAAENARLQRVINTAAETVSKVADERDALRATLASLKEGTP